jgi:hypothetical protein
MWSDISEKCASAIRISESRALIMDRTVSLEILVQLSQITWHHTPEETNPRTAVNIQSCTLQQDVKFIIILLPCKYDYYKRGKMMLELC